MNNKTNFKHYAVLFALLFLFWFLLSGRTETKFLLMGLGTSALVVWITAPLLKIPSIDGQGYYMAFQIPYLKFFVYCIWLLVEIIKANIDLAKVILSPEMPIRPRMVTFRKTMNNPVAHAVLGNSITLTPGTVTVDIVEDNLYLIHALTDAAADALIPSEGEGEMVVKVGELFAEHSDIGVRSGMMS